MKSVKTPVGWASEPESIELRDFRKAAFAQFSYIGIKSSDCSHLEAQCKLSIGAMVLLFYPHHRWTLNHAGVPLPIADAQAHAIRTGRAVRQRQFLKAWQEVFILVGVDDSRESDVRQDSTRYQQSTRLELPGNTKAAKKPGLKIAPSIFPRARRMIE